MVRLRVLVGDVRYDELQAALEMTRKANPHVRDGLPYILALQLDRSQNHLAKFASELNAKTMRKGRGLEKATHQRNTHWPRRPVDFRSDNCLENGSCAQCRDTFLRNPAHHTGDLQTIGRKGLAQVLTERGVPTKGLTGPQMAEI